jgi:phage baseplate assembly protein W
MDLDAAGMRDTERKRLRSLVAADMDTADALHAADYELITPRGYAMSKHDYLGRIGSGRLRYLVFEPVSDIAVRGGGEVALLRYQARISVNEDSGDDTAVMTCWHTDCYERRDARWQAVWSQATVIRPE